MIRKRFRKRIDWNSVTVEVTYEPNWLGGADSTIAHLQIRSVAPEGAPLPVTEPGYRSYFTDAAEIAEGGGPVAYVRSWLDAAASSPAWRAQQEAARQLSLF